MEPAHILLAEDDPVVAAQGKAYRLFILDVSLPGAEKAPTPALT